MVEGEGREGRDGGTWADAGEMRGTERAERERELVRAWSEEARAKLDEALDLLKDPVYERSS